MKYNKVVAMYLYYWRKLYDTPYVFVNYRETIMNFELWFHLIHWFITHVHTLIWKNVTDRSPEQFNWLEWFYCMHWYCTSAVLTNVRLGWKR